MEPTYSQKDIVDLGIPTRTASFWSDQGVLLPTRRAEDAGSGVHRRFATGEVDIAAILLAAAPQKLPIGILKLIAAWIRKIQAAPKDLRLKLGFELRFDDTNAITKIVNLHQTSKRGRLWTPSNGLLMREVSSLGHVDTGMIVSWYSYYAARHRPEREQRIMMSVSTTPYGLDGYISDVWGDNFDWSPERDGRFDFTSFININLSAAFEKLHDTATCERDATKRLLDPDFDFVEDAEAKEELLRGLEALSAADTEKGKP
jgi:hypothetical protein